MPGILEVRERPDKALHAAEVEVSGRIGQSVRTYLHDYSRVVFQYAHLCNYLSYTSAANVGTCRSELFC